MSFSVFEKIDPSCQNGSMEKAKNLPYHQRPYASIAERTLVDISIYSPRPQIAGTGHRHSKISIHSPRAGRDCRYPNAPLITQISIHSSHTGRDVKEIRTPEILRFQSTLPAWGETEHHVADSCPQRFQSTLPAWGETRLRQRREVLGHISIHSPRMGRDCTTTPTPSRPFYFNPLSPHGERLANPAKTPDSISFQSTLPAWGETPCPWWAILAVLISIHSPRMGRDWRWTPRPGA